MSGHSKWNNIKHRKGAADSARGKIFTKHSKIISIAARSGSDPEMNSVLKTAIANAKANNVPNNNIERAIKKGSGEGKDGAIYHELIYEGFAQNGVSFIIEAFTDNLNRTYTSIRTIVEKNGGHLGAPGSVSYMFKDKGYMELIKNGKNADDIEVDVIESGAEDMEKGDDRIFITTKFEDLGLVRDYLLSKNYEIENIKKQKVPENYIQISDVSVAKKLLKMIDKIEEDDDVSEVFHNADIDYTSIDDLL